MCVCIHVYVCMHNTSGELSEEVNVLPKMGGGIVRGNCPGRELSIGELSYISPIGPALIQTRELGVCSPGCYC